MIDRQTGGGVPQSDHPTFLTRDFWLAAFLDTLGVPLIEAHTINGRIEFSWDNSGERAYRGMLDARADNGNDLVSLKMLRASYRRMQDISRRVKEEHYDGRRIN